jgi:serine/threonine protein kinase, bacterial
LVHDRQIIHRDIKPENIILQQRDQKPALIDFGAVRESMGLKLTPQGQSTQSIVIGTPGYMPSEQAAGRAMFSSDLYALGLTAIYALTGKIPQELPTDPMTGEIQWRAYAPTVSNGLAGILDRAIASHSRDRFTTAAQMMETLRSGFVSGMGVPGTVVSGAIPTQVSGAYPVNPAPVYPAPDSQIRTVVAAPGDTAYPSQPAYPSQTGYGSPVPVAQSSGQDPKTWLMAIGVGALVALAGVGIYTMLRGKDAPVPVASSSVTPITSPVATPSPTISVTPAAIATPSPVVIPAPVSDPTPVPIVPASIVPASPSPVAIKPTVNPAPSSDFNAEIMDPPSNCRSNPSATAPVQKVLQRGDVLVDRTNARADSKGGVWYREQYLDCWIHQTQLQFKS